MRVGRLEVGAGRRIPAIPICSPSEKRKELGEPVAIGHAGAHPTGVVVSTPPARRRSRIEVEDVGNVSVVGFIDRKILDEQNIQTIGDDLFRLVEELGRRKVLLDFGNVEYIPRAMLGKLVTLQRKMEAVQGKLVLFRLDRDIRDLFRSIKLDRLFLIATGTTLTAPDDAIAEHFGNPFRSIVSPNWQTDTVLLLAKQMHKSNEFSAMPILADALQDAGCDCDDLLGHCRSGGSPIRQRWLLDVVLGKA